MGTCNTLTPSVIRYEKMVVNGIMIRPRSRDIIRKAIEGHPIEIASDKDYVNLYHVFDRLAASTPAIVRKNLRLVRRQIDTSKWMLFVTPDPVSVVQLKLNAGYHPKRGRYKTYAQQLAEGQVLKFADRNEAVKARRAWRFYIPKRDRANLRSVVIAPKRAREYEVSIRPKTSRSI